VVEDAKHVLDLQAKWGILEMQKLSSPFYALTFILYMLRLAQSFDLVLACLSVFADRLAHPTGIVFNSVVMYGL